eukprot:1191200-Prorocentrum_minimum.AAC.2
MAASMSTTPSGLPLDPLRILSRPCPDLSRPCPDPVQTPSGPPLDPLTFPIVTPDVVDGDHEARQQNAGGRPQHSSLGPQHSQKPVLPFVTFEHLALRAHRNVALLP